MAGRTKRTKKEQVTAEVRGSAGTTGLGTSRRRCERIANHRRDTARGLLSVPHTYLLAYRIRLIVRAPALYLSQSIINKDHCTLPPFALDNNLICLASWLPLLTGRTPSWWYACASSVPQRRAAANLDLISGRRSGRRFVL